MDKLMLPIWYKTWPSVKNEEITENWTKRIHELDVQPVSSTNKGPSSHLAKYKQSYLSSDLVNLTLYGTKTIIWLSPINIVSFILGVMIGSFKLQRKQQISIGWTWRFLKDSQGIISEKYVTSKHLERQHSIRSYLIKTDARNFFSFN